MRQVEGCAVLGCFVGDLGGEVCGHVSGGGDLCFDVLVELDRGSGVGDLVEFLGEVGEVGEQVA
ncbi:hypothetical protein [Streptacidiphilus sp. PAMC 29251]